jgi:mannose-6-phosphate isomerase-like protein (cupin superfamily)
MAAALSRVVHLTAGSDRFSEPLVFRGDQLCCKVSAADTNGALCVYDTIRTQQSGPPLHYHHHQDEWFFVRDGEFLFQVGEEKLHLTAGDSVLAPRKIPHAFLNLRVPGILTIAYAPAGTIEQFFREGSKLINATVDDWQILHRAHGQEMIGPPLSTC